MRDGKFLIGFVVLIIGAEVMMHGAEALSIHMGISPMVIGETEVLVGSPAPDLVVSVSAISEGALLLPLGVSLAATS